MIIILLFVKFCHSLNTNYDDKIPDITIYDNTIEIDRLLYGDITKMDDLYLPSTDDIDNFDDISESYIREHINKNMISNSTWNLDDIKLPKAKNWQDIKEFNEITKSVLNITKKYNNLKPGPLTRRYWYQDTEDGREEYYSMRYKKESAKKERLSNLMITFLIHARYQLKKVLTSKYPIREDKRYRIGYIFNRLRHLQYEQRKIVSTARMQIYYEYDDFYNLLKLYEKVIRADIDIIDTITFLKSMDLEKDKFIPLSTTKDS